MENFCHLTPSDVEYIERNNNGIPRCNLAISYKEASLDTLPDLNHGERVCFSACGKPSVRYRVIRIHGETDDKRKDQMKHVLSRLALFRGVRRHPNLISILGIYASAEAPLAFVSLSSSITIKEYLLAYPEFDRRLCCLGIAKGLDHLHRNGVVHGAVRGSNVLVNPDTAACMLGELADEGSPGSDTIAHYANWIAPELADVSRFQRLQVDHYRQDEYRGEYKMQSDIFALGCTAVEIYTGGPPRLVRVPSSISSYKELTTLGRSVSAVERDLIPERLLSAISQMMSVIPGRRPDSGNAVTYIEYPDMFRVTCFQPVHAKTMMRRYARRAIF